MDNTENSLMKKEPQNLEQSVQRVSYQNGYLKPFEEEKHRLEVLIKSGSLPADCKTPESVYMKMAYGAELGFTDIEALHMLTMISGTQTVNAKGVSRLFALNKYTFRLVKNAEFIYFGEGKTVYSDRKLTPAEVIAKLEISPETFKGLNETKRNNIPIPIDRETKIEYGIVYPNRIEWLGFHSYFWSDAVLAKLDLKETYQKYPKDMMLHRCKVGLSKVLGVLTAPETEELAIVKNIRTDVVDGQVEIME